MASDRTTLRTTAAIPRRPPTATTIQRSAVAVASSPAQVLQQRLGNQGTQALLARAALVTESSRAKSSRASSGTASATSAAGPTALVSPSNVPAAPHPVGQAPLPAPQGPRDQAGASAEPETPVAKIAPKSSKDDPAFQGLIKQTRQTKAGLKKHKAPEVKKQEVTEAAHLAPQEQTAYNDRKQHLETINQTAASHKDAKQVFTAQQFKGLLEKNLKELETQLPQTEAGAEQFKRDKPLEKIKGEVSLQVKDQNKKVAAPITAETQKTEPPKSGIDPTVAKDVGEEKAGAKPRPIDPVAAAPKPLADSEISLEKEGRRPAELMAKNHNTDEQLSESKDAGFKKALTTKQQAEEKAAAAPQQYRSREKQILAVAQKGAQQRGSMAYGAMFGKRGTAFVDVFQKQSQTAKDDKIQQAAVKTELERIYNGTKTAVETIFSELSTYVDETFNAESTAAKTAFEERVEDQLSDIHGLGVKDFLFGEDTEAIEKVFAVEKQRFLNAMDRTLNAIAQRIADDLNKAVARIQEGKDEAEKFYKNLDKEQQRLSADAMETFRVQFANLETSVDEKQTELAHSLAESYKQNKDSLRATFDKINEDVKKNWIERALEFLKEVAMTIYRLGELLVTVLARVAGVIGDILAHPIRFLENLAAGIKQGFKTFASNFDTYLIAAFFDWLRGKVGGAGIKLPAKFDTAGLFSLALQVIGLTYDNFRRIAAQKLGEPVVALIEKGVEGAQEVYKLLQMARSDIGAFWSHLKDVLANTVDEIFEKIKKTVLYETIKKVLAYIVTLFNPAGAFIKAAQAIYAGIRFLMDNIDRIVALVNAFLDSVEMAVKGNVGGIAAKVIFGLQNAIVLGIDFLAKLLGLGNLADKVRAIIKQLSTPVERAMGFVVDKVLRPVVKLVTKAGKSVVETGKAGIKRLVNWWKKKVPINSGNERHTLLFEGSDKSAKLVVRSEPEKPSVFLDKAGEKKGITAAKRKTPVATAVDHENEVGKLLDSLKKVDETATAAAAGREADKADALAKKLDAKLDALGTHLGGTLGKWGVADAPIKDVKLPREKFTREQKRGIAAQHKDKSELRKDSKGERINVQKGLARRHVVSSHDISSHYVEVLNKKKISEGKLLLEQRGSITAARTAVTDASQEGIQTAASTRYSGFFGYLRNLFIGDSRENSSIQEHLDAGHPDLAGKKLEEHVSHVKRAWALDESIKISRIEEE